MRSESQHLICLSDQVLKHDASGRVRGGRIREDGHWKRLLGCLSIQGAMKRRHSGFAFAHVFIEIQIGQSRDNYDLSGKGLQQPWQPYE